MVRIPPSQIRPVLRPELPDEADFWCILRYTRNKGLDGDKPGTKSVLRIAKFAP